jgi:hypothetical protein
LDGARLTLTGEPITESRAAAVAASGADATTNYGSNEAGGFIGYGCLAPERPDEVHLFHDLHALIHADRAEGPLPQNALMISSLRPTAPLVLLNVSMGDAAAMSERACGCGLEKLGWKTHLHTIRSFEKLSAGGVTFFDTDLIRLLEDVLPKTFGGGPTDYQLVEEEASDERPRLRLLIHPAVGPVDEELVANMFLKEIGADSPGGRVVELVWRGAEVLQVERREPERTTSGKIQHLHVHHRPAQGGSQN